MLFEDRTEYDNWIKSGMPEQWGKNNKYSYAPDCANCNYAKIINDYEKLGWNGVHKVCRICLGLGKYKKKKDTSKKKIKTNKSISTKEIKSKKDNNIILKKEIKPKKNNKNINKESKKNSIGKKYYIGAEFNTKYDNIKLKIIKKGRDQSHYWVEFQDKHKYKVDAHITNINNGTIKNPYHRNIYNVGYYGEGKYKSSYSKGKMSEVYSDWNEMLKRSYSEKLHIRRPTYIGCEVCEEWHNFQVFAEWAENTGSLYKGWHLDKDLLSKGSKLYSPETCVYLPQSINSLLTKVNLINVNIKKIKNRQLKITEIMEKYKDELDEEIYELIMKKFDPIIKYKES